MLIPPKFCNFWKCQNRVERSIFFLTKFGGFIMFNPNNMGAAKSLEKARRAAIKKLDTWSRARIPEELKTG